MLFGSKFSRFMEGFKHKGSIVSGDTERGFYDPLKTNVNFAVPGNSVLSNYCPFNGLERYKHGVQPGVINPVVEMYAANGKEKSHILTFDGKKIVPNSAEINLLGCEDQTTLKMQQTLREDESCINRIETVSQNIQTAAVGFLQDLNTNSRNSLVMELKTIFRHIGCRLQTVRDSSNKKSYTLTKLQSKTDTLLTKDHFLINHLKTYLYQSSMTVNDTIKNLNDLCEIIAALNGASQNLAKTNKVNLSLQGNFAELIPPSHISQVLETEMNKIPSKYLKQRSPEWFEVRNGVKVTGSSINKAIGLDSLKEQKSYFDEVISGETVPKRSEQLTAMEYGSRNEVNAIATVVGKVMPVLYPDLVFYEEGTYQINDHETHRSVLCVSPDGSLREATDSCMPLDGRTRVGIEIKCPFNNAPLKNLVFYMPPKRYVSQCLLEQHVLKSDEQLLISWSPETTTVIQVPGNKHIVDGLLSEAKDLYYSEVPHRPTKITENTKLLSAQIDEHMKTCKFLGDFPSVTCIQGENTTRTEAVRTHRIGKPGNLNVSIPISEEYICKTLLTSKSILRSMMNLYEKKASEVVVFSLTDTDRTWKKEIAHGLPIGYFTRGYSLTTDTMRNIQAEMLRSCTDAGIHIPCVTFDGQWYKLKDEASDGSPLTLFQLQRAFWTDICAMSKDDILKKLFQVNRKVIQEEAVLTYEVQPNMILKPKQRMVVVKSDDRKLKLPKGGARKLGDTVIEPVIYKDRDMSSEILDTETDTVDEPPDELGAVTIPYIREEHEEAHYHLTDEDKTCIRALLLNSNRKKKPFTSDVLNNIDLFFQSSVSLKYLTDQELKAVIDYLNISLKGKRKELCAKGTKGKKISEICTLFGISEEDSNQHVTRRKLKKSLRSLQEILKLYLKKFDKIILAAIYANYKWPEVEQDWRNKVNVGNVISVRGTENSFKPVYSPEIVEVNDKKMLQVKCLDGHHIKTNIRAKLCRAGTDELKKKAWIDVANSKKTDLSITMIEVNKDGKILDQQNDKYVRTMFSDTVERELHNQGYKTEACFTKLFREWYEAEDHAGISAENRCKRALALRKWLLSDVSFEEFPPPGMHIKGFPKVTFEGLICSIEAHLYLYELCKSGTFNWRSVSTLVAENIFSEISEMEHHNNDVPTGASFQRNMAVTAGLHAIRLKPDRPFCMQTARSRKYPIPEIQNFTENSVTTVRNDPFELKTITEIRPRKSRIRC